MKKIDLVMYDAPQVEILEVEVEKGFAVSPGDGDVEAGGMGGIS